jgi:hypothetical protein
MGLDLSEVRLPVLIEEAIQSLDEGLTFRHLVWNVYTFSFDHERIGRLVNELKTAFEMELLTLANHWKVFRFSGFARSE